MVYVYLPVRVQFLRCIRFRTGCLTCRSWLLSPILFGVERQVAVVAYQLGDAFTNFIVPTSGCLLGALAAAKLDWGKWAKFQIKFQAVLFAFGSIAVILAVVIGLS